VRWNKPDHEYKVVEIGVPQLKLVCSAALVVACISTVLAQSPVPSLRLDEGPATPPASPQLPGTIQGAVVDQSGAVVAGAYVRLTQDTSTAKEQRSDTNGQFSFSDVAAGPFRLTITAPGLQPQTLAGILNPGEIHILPATTLPVATAVTAVNVGVASVEVAEEQIKLQEKQRVLGVIPNFLVSYIPDAAPLNASQKFKLAGRMMVDPFTFVMVAGAAGIAQGQNHFAGYGQGAAGYAKRYGAGYADMASATFLGSAVFPSLFKQDPRYFYKGTGSKPSRVLYAVGNAMICKGDNGHWQANYSNVLGNLAAGGISNLYYPEQDRNGPALTFENGAIGIAATAVANVFQEFVVKKLTPKLPTHDQGKP